MKIFHASDLHYCSKQLAVVDKAFGFAVDHAIDNQAECAVISGDSIDSTMGIHEPAVAAYLAQIKRLADHMPVLVLQGTFSHDRPGSLDILKTIAGEFPVYVADKAEQIFLSDGAFHSCDKQGEHTIYAVFNCLPSLNKADPHIVENGAGEYVCQLMKKWQHRNEYYRRHAVPTVLVSHGTINGCVTESSHAMISPDHEFTTETLFGFDCAAVMLGHIHKHQAWVNNSGQVIAYPGSIARMIYGHYDPVGFLMWDIRAFAKFDFIETPSPRLTEITFDGPPNIDELRTIAAKIGEGDRVRLRYSLDQEHAHAVDKDEIKKIFEACDDLKIESTINPIQSIRAAGIGRAMTLDEKLGYWAVTTGDEDRLDELSGRLHLLRSMTPDEIFSATIKQETKHMEAA